jgi:hypothetical protein
MVAIGSGAERETTEYHLNRKQTIYICTQAGTPKARAMTIQVVEVFDQWVEGNLVPIPYLIKVNP